MKSNNRNLASILTGASDGFWKSNPGLGATIADTVTEHSGKYVLGNQGEAKKEVDKTSNHFHVKLTRRGKRKLDYDNLVGGAKSLRDAIAEDLLKLKGDAPEDGITFEYSQVVTKETTDTLVEIFKVNTQEGI